LEGAAFEEILILDFPGDEEAKAWYHSPEYQAASEPSCWANDMVATRSIATVITVLGYGCIAACLVLNILLLLWQNCSQAKACIAIGSCAP
jgi:hypothetical protein